MVSEEQIDPLTDLDEVLSWNPPEDEEPYTYPDCYPRSSFFLPGATWRGGDRSWDSLVSTSLVRSQGGDRVKTLLCHDMMGGYLEDRFTAGCEGDTADTGYTFRHWANIDYFVYFSHHFVTLPPVGWIAAARYQVTETETGLDRQELKVSLSLSVCNKVLFHSGSDLKHSGLGALLEHGNRSHGA